MADRLRTLRKQAKLSQDRLGAIAGIDGGAVSQTERARNVPTLETVEKLAAALGIDAAWLAYGHEAHWQFRKKQPRPAVPFDAPEPRPGQTPYQRRAASCGERVRQGREQLGVALRPLAEAAQVSYQTVNLIETGATVPRVDTVEALAVALDVPPGWLAFGEEQ